MKTYDVIIVGAGPAGGQLARELSFSGKKVLLLERNRDFSTNNYSSGGAPIEIMEMFALPESIVGSSWNKMIMHSSTVKNVWEREKRAGVIMDFAKLRSFLAKEAEKFGATVKLGIAYLDYQYVKDGVETLLKHQDTKEKMTLKTKILVDATGSDRAVLAKKLHFKGHWFPSTGIEYLVKVDSKVYQKWANALSVFMGKAWMPQGYSWIFPMEPNTLKVGVGRYFQNQKFMPYNNSYKHYLEILMNKCLGQKDWPILDKHGKTIVYTYRRSDIHVREAVLAIGDAVSTINPLAFEGIRHAMMGARIAAKHIEDKFAGKQYAFEHYKRALHQHFGWKWRLSETLMKVIYKEPKDENIDLMLKAWKHFSFDQMLSMAFDYNPLIALKFLGRYTYYKTKKALNV